MSSYTKQQIALHKADLYICVTQSISDNKNIYDLSLPESIDTTSTHISPRLIKTLQIHQLRLLKSPRLFMETLLSPDSHIQQLALESTSLLLLTINELSITEIIDNYFSKFSLLLKSKFLNKVSHLHSLPEDKADELFDALYTKYNTTYIYTIFSCCSFDKLIQNLDLLFKFPFHKTRVLREIYRKRPTFFAHLFNHLEQQNMLTQALLKSIIPFSVNKAFFLANVYILFNLFNNKPILSYINECQLSNITINIMFKTYKQKIIDHIDHFSNYSFNTYMKYSFTTEIVYKVIQYQFVENKKNDCSYYSLLDILNGITKHKEKVLEYIIGYLEFKGNISGFNKIGYSEIRDRFNVNNKSSFERLQKLNMIDEDTLKALTPPEEFVANVLKNSTPSAFLESYSNKQLLISSCLLNSKNPYKTLIRIVYDNFKNEKENEIVGLIGDGLSLLEISKLNTYTQYYSKNFGRKNRTFKRSPNKISDFSKYIIQDVTLKLLDEMIKMMFYRNRKKSHESHDYWNNFWTFSPIVTQLIRYCRKSNISYKIYMLNLDTYNIERLPMYNFKIEKTLIYNYVFEKLMGKIKKDMKMDTYRFGDLLRFAPLLLAYNESIEKETKIEIEPEIANIIENNMKLQSMQDCIAYGKIASELNFEFYTDKRIKEYFESLKEGASMEYSKDLIMKLLNRNIDFIIHFKNQILSNFKNVPNVVKSLLLERLEHPVVKEIHSEFISSIQNYTGNEEELNDNQYLANRIISAIKFLSYTNKFPFMIEKILLNSKINNETEVKWNELTLIKQAVLQSIKNYHNPEEIITMFKENYPKDLKIESLCVLKSLLEKMEPVKFENLISQLLEEHGYNLLFVRLLNIHSPHKALAILNSLSKIKISNKQTISIILYIKCCLKTNENLGMFELMEKMINELNYELFEQSSDIRKLKNLPDSIKRRHFNVIISKTMRNTDNFATSCCYGLLKENCEYLTKEQMAVLFEQELQYSDKSCESAYLFGSSNKPLIFNARFKVAKGMGQKKEIFTDFIRIAKKILTNVGSDFKHTVQTICKLSSFSDYVYKKIFNKNNNKFPIIDKVELIDFVIGEWNKEKIPLFNTDNEILKLKQYRNLVLYYNEESLDKFVDILIEAFISKSKSSGTQHHICILDEAFISVAHSKNKNVRNKLFEYLDQSIKTQKHPNKLLLSVVIELYYCYKLDNLKENEYENIGLFNNALQIITQNQDDCYNWEWIARFKDNTGY